MATVHPSGEVATVHPSGEVEPGMKEKIEPGMKQIFFFCSICYILFCYSLSFGWFLMMVSSRRWGHWTTLNFAADVWNALDIML